jgi:three-Cys-motif partner protein
VPVPEETVWSIDSHTRAKHDILRRYLGAWFGILGSRFPRIVYMDGFCGPGRYSGGELGSPIVAIKEALAQAKRIGQCEVVFLFSDERADRIEHLRSELGRIEVPPAFKTHTYVGRFSETLGSVLDDLDRSGGRLAPTFAFIDPFGFSDLPFDLIARILRNPYCEVFINFMVNAVQRFVEHPVEALRDEIAQLFGTRDVARAVSESPDRVEGLRQLYQIQLGSQAAFVRSFAIKDSPNRVLYYLFFATNSRLGHAKMKEAMWSVDRGGQFQFVDNTMPDQLILLGEDHVAPLVHLIAKRFAGSRVSAGQVFEAVVDETGFIEAHAREGLKTMERHGQLTVEGTKTSGGRRRKGSFPPDAVVRFPA